jgi:hypothetical protein
MTTTVALTSAERTRRHRARQREARDSVRSFLEAIIEAAEAAVAASTPHEGDEPGTKYPEVEAWQLARADLARDYIDRLDANLAVNRPRLTWRLIGRTDEEVELIYEMHERAFERWRLIPGNVPKSAREDAPALSLAETSLTWAAALLRDDKATSPVLAQGLRAARRLIDHRQRPVVTAAYADYTAYVNVRDGQHAFLDGQLVPMEGRDAAEEGPTDDSND